jgi:superfamily I DNA/RNA helicase
LLTAPLKELAVSRLAATEIAARLISFLSLEDLARTFPDYRRADNLETVAQAIEQHLGNSAEQSDGWRQVVDSFEGVGSIPLMTVHKSKGLEFETMVFAGLDDETWWSYSADNPEGLATFFVAFSRAKQRAIFTYCSERGSRHKVAELFDLLTQAAVPEVSHTNDGSA